MKIKVYEVDDVDTIRGATTAMDSEVRRHSLDFWRGGGGVGGGPIFLAHHSYFLPAQKNFVRLAINGVDIYGYSRHSYLFNLFMA